MDDEHAHMNITLDYFDKFLVSGDYVCVEDAAIHQPLAIGMGLKKELGYEALGDELLIAMKEFITKHPDRYVVDSYYTDFYG